MFCLHKTPDSIDYSHCTFTNSVNTVYTIETPNIQDVKFMQLAVIRDKLYGLKPLLYILVKDVFSHQQRNGYTNQEYWQVINRLTKGRSKLDGDNQEKVDPSNLLQLLVRSDCFKNFNQRGPVRHTKNNRLLDNSTEEQIHDIHFLARTVNIYRHEYYGHLPDLSYNVDDEVYDRILSHIDELSILIENYLSTSFQS